MDEARYDNKCNPGKLYYKKGTKNEIIRNGDKFNLTIFGFQTFDGNSLIHFSGVGRTLDISLFYCLIRIVNMESKENAGKLQLIVDKYRNDVESIRNNKFDRSTVKKKVLKEELIEKKIKILEDGLKKLSNDEINELLSENENLIEFLDLKNLEEEISNEKLFKREKFKENKAKTERSLLYQFEKELTEGNWKEMFENEKRIVIVLDNARIHIAKISKRIAKVLNIKLVFLESHSSDINPIERVWYSVKDKLSCTYVEDEIFLITQFSEHFYNYANSRTLVEKWLNTYIT